MAFVSDRLVAVRRLIVRPGAALVLGVLAAVVANAAVWVSIRHGLSVHVTGAPSLGVLILEVAAIVLALATGAALVLAAVVIAASLIADLLASFSTERRDGLDDR